MKDLVKKYFSLLVPFAGLAFVTFLFAFLIYVYDESGDKETFYNFIGMGNFKNIMKQAVIVGIGGLGMTLVIISAGIDLSVGSLVALGSVAMALVLKHGATGPEDAQVVSGGIMFLAFLASIGACALFGFINGLISAKFKIVPFIVTLGTMQVARGSAKWLAGNEPVRTPDNMFQNFMSPQPDPEWLFFAPGVWIMLILAIIMILVLRYTVFGRYVYAIGSNEDTARLCGINVNFYKIMIYVLCGALTGVAGAMLYSDLTSGSPTEAIGLELNIIAAVVIGGASLSGGEGSALGTIIGAMIMAVLVNGCQMLQVPKFYQEIIIGSIIILAVGIDKLKHRKAS